MLPIVLLMGPTAAGKSALALALASLAGVLAIAAFLAGRRGQRPRMKRRSSSGSVS